MGLFYHPPSPTDRVINPPPPPSWCSAKQYGSNFGLINYCNYLFVYFNYCAALTSSQLLGRYLRFENCVQCLLTRKDYSVKTLVAVHTASIDGGGIFRGGGGGITEKTQIRFSRPKSQDGMILKEYPPSRHISNNCQLLLLTVLSVPVDDHLKIWMRIFLATVARNFFHWMTVTLDSGISALVSFT